MPAAMNTSASGSPMRVTIASRSSGATPSSRSVCSTLATTAPRVSASVPSKSNAIASIGSCETLCMAVVVAQKAQPVNCRRPPLYPNLALPLPTIRSSFVCSGMLGRHDRG